MTLLDMIHAALKEDMPTGDLTTESLALAPRPGEARLIAKCTMTLSGSGPFEESIMVLDPLARVQWFFKEGDVVQDRQIICRITGDLIQVLKAERVSLNFLGHLSGIATLTRKYVDKVAHTKTKILDTRKTIPTYRELAKKAVVHGGGQNHRSSLSEAILIKDNHITVAGGLSKAVARIREHSSEKIEVEASDLAQVKEAVNMKVNCILLDNMGIDMMRDALKLIPPTILTEASGNMNLDRVAAVAELGGHLHQRWGIDSFSPFGRRQFNFRLVTKRSNRNLIMADFDVGRTSEKILKQINIETWFADNTTSTNTIAKEETPSTPLKVYIANHQSAGRGRNQNSWSDLGKGTAFLSSWSFAFSKSPQPILAPLVGLCVYECLSSFSSGFALKAPNDILFDGKKVCGILIENIIAGSSGRCIVGIGLNVFKSPSNLEATHLSAMRPVEEKNWQNFFDGALFESRCHRKSLCKLRNECALLQ